MLFLLLLGITLWQPSALAASGMLVLLRFVMALLPAFASAILLYCWFDNYAAVNGKLFVLEVRPGGFNAGGGVAGVSAYAVTRP